jgi:UDP-glucose 4-epimerase
MLTHGNKTEIQPARVLILGARGFLALRLQQRLAAAGIKYRAIGSSELDLTQPQTSSEILARLIEPTDTVVMMSALTPDKGRDYHVLLRNLQMADTVGRALEATTCAHFVYLSSDAVYDAHKIPLDEDSTREPVDLYALTHTAREMILGSVLAKKNIPLCVLRPTTIYGPGDTHNNYGPNRFTRTAVAENRIVLFGRGEERRSHVYIDDAMTLIQGTILRRSMGTLNLAANPPVSFFQVAEAVIRLCPQPVRLEFAPRTIQPVHRPYKPTQIFRFIYNLGRKIGPIVHRPYSVAAVFKAFPEFHYTSLTEGLSAQLSALRLAHPTGEATP